MLSWLERPLATISMRIPLPCDLRFYGDNLQVGRGQPLQVVEQLGPRECTSSNQLIDVL